MANNTVTYSWTSGGRSSDGLQSFSLIEFSVMFPGAFPGNVILQGVVQGVTGAGAGNPSEFYAIPTGTPPGSFTGVIQNGTVISPPIAFSNNSLALPAVPAGGLSLNWIVEVNIATGVLATKTGVAATTGIQLTPSVDAGNILVLTHTLTNGDTIPWLRAPVFPDMWP